ncbi:hypothetical protein [Streptomyces sp. NRRL B-24085]|uniref:hypothetical protein n=1 Tax=Streptomyces sp. NRRL B-24085 TaxID=1709476 RepID=UPI000A383F6E|nr:hypothetical protein [Streptomyces sp. NRRL B-24085]
MSIPLRRYADDHVRTVVAITAALRLPGLTFGEDRPGPDRPASEGHPGLPLRPAAPERQERTP